MLDNLRKQVSKFSSSTEEYFTLAVLNVFLNIQSDGFRSTEIFHCFRNCYAQLCTQAKEVIDSMA